MGATFQMIPRLQKMTKKGAGDPLNAKTQNATPERMAPLPILLCDGPERNLK
jgi:hypothetical protein